MNHPTEILLRHGSSLFFLSVFLEEAGLPIPAAPFILAAGALAGSGKQSAAFLLALGVLASTLGDLIWYELGRLKGGKILKVLCRISLEPDSCVGAAKAAFARHGPSGLITAKFVPGFGAVMPSLTGLFKVGAVEFLIFDGLGSLLYVGAYGLVGYIFSDQLDLITDFAERLGPAVALALAGGLAGYVGYKWIRRRMFFKKLKMARITPEELQEMREAGKEVMIVDVRSRLDLKTQPIMIPGARWIPMEEFNKRHQEIPRDREVVLYCSCPNEASAAQVAGLLQKHGVENVRPLKGGLDAWVERGYRTEQPPLPR